ncbi:MAG: P-loop NTPase, partial [Spirochaetes bacterium]|nr:P-loop NTPase [Spirochaetota bacterium]
NRADFGDKDLNDYCSKENLHIIGSIPDDRQIAECYSNGELAVEVFPQVNQLFRKIFNKILNFEISAIKKTNQISKQTKLEKKPKNMVCNINSNISSTSAAKELVVISGKGGTGKTSLVASFAALEGKLTFSDCDVDAADLHLILKPEIIEKGDFSGGKIASINLDKCMSCEACYQACQFDSIDFNKQAKTYQINQLDCEGCGVCEIVCQNGAVTLSPHINGEWFISQTRFGPMSHAKLGIAEENSGKLVSLVRSHQSHLAGKYKMDISIIDSSPGTGCPVIASLTGSHYAVIVTEPTVSGIHDLKRIIDLTHFFQIPSGIIVNKYDINTSKSREIEEIAFEKRSTLLGMIPFDKEVTEAQIKGITVVEHSPNGKVTQSIREIWEIIKGKL